MIARRVTAWVDRPYIYLDPARLVALRISAFQRRRDLWRWQR